MVDQLLDQTLLRKGGVDKVSQASEEASRLKRLMGSLRYLYRNSHLAKLVFTTCTVSKQHAKYSESFCIL